MSADVRTGFAIFGPASGNVAVSLDGGAEVVVDLYRSTASWRVVGRSFPGLSRGSHTIPVRVLGTHNASSSASTVVVDAFRVTN